MPVYLAYRVYQLLWTALDWVYPPQCGGCGTLGTRWCATCAGQTRVIQSSICPKCGQVQNSDLLCFGCQSEPPRYHELRSWAVFGGSLREAIHHLKYHRNVGLGEVLARPLIQCAQDNQWSVDIVLPVPLSLARLAERGYNQASLLARPVALRLGAAYHPNGLTRVRNTASQVGLSSEMRKQNVEKAFRADRRRVGGKSVLVIDDVTTTGATMDACASALIEAGANRVFGLTLARSVIEGQA